MIYEPQGVERTHPNRKNNVIDFPRQKEREKMCNMSPKIENAKECHGLLEPKETKREPKGEANGWPKRPTVEKSIYQKPLFCLVKALFLSTRGVKSHSQINKKLCRFSKQQNNEKRGPKGRQKLPLHSSAFTISGPRAPWGRLKDQRNRLIEKSCPLSHNALGQGPGKFSVII